MSFSQPFFAHTLKNQPPENWEPLFTPFGEAPANQCQREHCEKCHTLAADHGHLNKVAYRATNHHKKAGYPEEHCPQNLIIATKRTTSSDQLPTAFYPLLPKPSN